MKTKTLAIVITLITAPVFAQHDHGHEHEAGSSIDLQNQVSVLPSVEIELKADTHTANAFNLKLKVNAFRFAPDHVNQDHQLVDQEIGLIAEGHAHLMINGVKVTRLYGPHFFLQNINAGDLISVQLNSNDHRSFTIMGYDIGQAEHRIP